MKNVILVENSKPLGISHLGNGIFFMKIIDHHEHSKVMKVVKME